MLNELVFIDDHVIRGDLEERWIWLDGAVIPHRRCEVAGDGIGKFEQKLDARVRIGPTLQNGAYWPIVAKD